VLLALVQVVTPDLDDVLVGLDEDVLEVEKHVFSAERGDHTQQIYKLKRELLELRRATGPAGGRVQRLADRAVLPGAGRRCARTSSSSTGAPRAPPTAWSTWTGLIDGVLDAQVAQIGVGRTRTSGASRPGRPSRWCPPSSAASTA
jgi:magnesium transporter